MLSQPYRPTKIGTIVAKETPKCIQVKVLHEALKNNPDSPELGGSMSSFNSKAIVWFQDCEKGSVIICKKTLTSLLGGLLFDFSMNETYQQLPYSAATSQSEVRDLTPSLT